jgi:hypothetical protein
MAENTACPFGILPFLFDDHHRLTTSQTVNAVVDDLEIWRTLNAIRGLTGVLNWILCSICVDKIRYWSIVEEPRSLSKQEMEIS